MKNYSIIVSIIFAFSVANVLADFPSDDQSVCAIRSDFQKNLADVATNDVGIQILNELRQVTENVCVDPKAHNGIVGLLDAIANTMTDPNVSEVVGASFYWIRLLIKNKNFRDIWYENVKGLNMWFDKEPIVSPLIDTIFDNLTDLLNDPLFDSTFERVISNMASMMNLGKNAFYKTGALASRTIGGRRNASRSNRRR